MLHMNRRTGKKYDLRPLLEYIDADPHLGATHGRVDCAYNPVFALGAALGLHVNYAIELLRLPGKIPMACVWDVMHAIRAQNMHAFFYPQLTAQLLATHSLAGFAGTGGSN